MEADLKTIANRFVTLADIVNGVCIFPLDSFNVPSCSQLSRFGLHTLLFCFILHFLFGTLPFVCPTVCFLLRAAQRNAL